MPNGVWMFLIDQLYGVVFPSILRYMKHHIADIQWHVFFVPRPYIYIYIYMRSACSYCAWYAGSFHLRVWPTQNKPYRKKKKKTGVHGSALYAFIASNDT